MLLPHCHRQLLVSEGMKSDAKLTTFMKTDDERDANVSNVAIAKT